MLATKNNESLLENIAGHSVGGRGGPLIALRRLLLVPVSKR